ncbi:hypothetical protein CASFOL_037777 [Castilleja foliolosa]|uniref:Trichome birefringence-like N-terminal domain-containing protein n=1 Tax=Castilleja foliolosa TaxID=1961234 RepID=A0ABD3BK96_9LAMI
MPHKAWETFLKFHHLIGITLVALAGAAFYLNHSLNYWNVVRKSMKEEKTTQCDYFSGRWVYDNVSYPIYNEEQCSFMDHIFACQKNGRKDFNYRYWRWQPRNCDIPRFNGKAFLEKIRGKKVLFVGDSVNRNQWVSLLCLIESSLAPSSKKSLTRKGNCNFFHSIEYNTTIGFYWSPFLVESNCDDYLNHRNLDNRVIKIEAIEKHARHWNDADILIFDSYAWWLSPNKLLWGSFENRNAIYKKVETKTRPYEMGLRTWSDWLEMNINRTKTKLFFMSVSPNILRGDTFRHCYNKSEPIPKNLLPSKPYHLMGVLEASIENLRARGINVEYLRITRMSEYRNDAHPSIYRATIGHLSEDNKKDPTTYTDCLHWCLPGVPDIWNQILYDYIMKS